MRMLTPVLAAALLLLATVSSAQPDANLITNSGFEAPGQGDLPRDWANHCTGESKAFRDTTTAHTGQACGHIVKVTEGKSHVSALVFPRVNVQGGAQYTLSGWGKGHVPTGSASLFLYQYDKDGKWLGCFFGSSVPQTDEWVPLHATARTLPECVWVMPRFEIFGEASVGEAWVDDVYFGQDATAPGAPRGLQATAAAAQAKLTWQAPAGEAPFGYQIYRAPYPRFSPGRAAWVAFTTGTEATLPVPPGWGSYFAVVAVDMALNQSPPQMTPLMQGPQPANLPAAAVWTADASRRWGPELPFPLPKSAPPALEMCRGECASLQVLVGATRSALPSVTVSVAPPASGKQAAEIQLFSQCYVELVNQGRFVPDPLVPATPQDIGPGMMQGWWLLVHTPPTLPAGEYRSTITVKGTGPKPQTIPLRLKVLPVTVPAGNHYGGSWGIWGGQMAEQEQVAMSSPEYRRLMDRYRAFFLEHRMVPREMPGTPDTPEGAAFLNDERVSAFPILTPAGWGKIMTPAQVTQFRQHCDYLRQKGWLSKGYIYNYDEPEPDKYAYCREMADRIREAGQDIPILLTEQPEPALYGAVDIWCPILHEYARTEKLCRERQALGEHVWWYVCLAPASPWPNYMLTNDPVDARALSWLQVQHQVEGELYWAVTCFPGDVWQQGLNVQWPGDGYLCYPGKPKGLDGPVTCIRAECIRDAKEDIELMWLLRQKARGSVRPRADTRGSGDGPAHAEAVIQKALGQVLTDFTHYSKREADYTAARRMVTDEIMRLGR